jgi:Mrp family chromosome partitioning ATPase
MKVVFVVGLKGGIGKSLVTSQLAYALSRQHISVGIIDADIPSPNIGEFFDVENTEITADNQIVTKRTPNNMIQIFSMSGMITDNSVSMNEEKYIELVMDVVERGDWSAEYLLIDMPAGASSIMKSLTEIFQDQLLGNIIVVQPAHIHDAERVMRWHEINDIHVIGLVENMSEFVCTQCHSTYKLFGESNVEELAKKYNTELLGVIPLSMAVRGAVRERTMVGGPISDVFDHIADIVLEARPQRPGFLSNIMEKGKDLVKSKIIEAFTNMLLVANKEVPIADIQQRSGYVGGRDIKILIGNDDMTETLQEMDIVLRDGQIRRIADGAEPKLTINIKAKALAGALLGYIKYEDRKIEYNLLDAYLNEDLTLKGEAGDGITALKFINETWKQVQVRDNGRVSKVLEMIM